MNTRNTNTIDLSDLFGSVVGALRDDQTYLNDLDRHGGNGNHGDNIVNNFQLIEQMLRQTSGQDAGTQLRQAAEALRQNGRGATANIYAEGLNEAAQQMQGQPGLRPEDILPFLQALLGGVQRQSGAQPGEGTLLDSLVPGILGYVQARNGGRNNSEAIMDGLGAAMRGSRRMYQEPARHGRSRRQVEQPWMDPGAASATTILEGLFRKLAGA
jgi:dihydroxyacetone kinase-like protein